MLCALLCMVPPFCAVIFAYLCQYMYWHRYAATRQNADARHVCPMGAYLRAPNCLPSSLTLPARSCFYVPFMPFFTLFKLTSQKPTRTGSRIRARTGRSPSNLQASWHSSDSLWPLTCWCLWASECGQGAKTRADRRCGCGCAEEAWRRRCRSAERPQTMQPPTSIASTSHQHQKKATTTTTTRPPVFPPTTCFKTMSLCHMPPCIVRVRVFVCFCA